MAGPVKVLYGRPSTWSPPRTLHVDELPDPRRWTVRLHRRAARPGPRVGRTGPAAPAPGARSGQRRRDVIVEEPPRRRGRRRRAQLPQRGAPPGWCSPPGAGAALRDQGGWAARSRGHCRGHARVADVDCGDYRTALEHRAALVARDRAGCRPGPGGPAAAARRCTPGQVGRGWARLPLLGRAVSGSAPGGSLHGATRSYAAAFDDARGLAGPAAGVARRLAHAPVRRGWVPPRWRLARRVLLYTQSVGAARRGGRPVPELVLVVLGVSARPAARHHRRAGRLLDVAGVLSLEDAAPPVAALLGSMKGTHQVRHLGAGHRGRGLAAAGRRGAGGPGRR